MLWQSVSVSDTEVITGVGSDRVVAVRTSEAALESGLSSGAAGSSGWVSIGKRRLRVRLAAWRDSPPGSAREDVVW